MLELQRLQLFALLPRLLELAFGVLQLRVRQDLDKSGSTTSSGYLKILSELPPSDKYSQYQAEVKDI